jgi:hypothetical protein
MADETPDALALKTFKYAGSLLYVEDFERAWNDTMRDPEGRAALTIASQQAQAHGQDHGGTRCCGTTDAWHQPWCEMGPRRHRPTSAVMATVTIPLDTTDARQNAALAAGHPDWQSLLDDAETPIVEPPPPSIVIMADDGTELLRLAWPDGRLDVTGDESRWTEAAARFVAEMRRLADA